jgi:serine/threonine protein kinase
LKLADFGLASILKPNQLMTVACGTPGYVAPEILRGIAYGRQVDIWSIGVILYILLCGFPPFYDDNNKKLFAQIINAQYTFPDPYWTNISPQAKDLVQKLLVVDPTKRLTAEQILAHPWMHEDGSKLSLDHFRPNLKSYNARRRFRSAIRAVQLTQMLRKITKGAEEANADGSKNNNGNQNPVSILSAVEAEDKVGVGLDADMNDLTETITHGNSFKSPIESDSEDDSRANTKTKTTTKTTTAAAAVAAKIEKIPEEISSRPSPTVKVEG